LLATYNGERFLRAQLDSIFAQTQVDVSVLARDDGSTDATLAILAEYAARYPQRLLVLERTARLGAMGSFFALMAAATGHYVAFADQDDIWLENKLQTLAARLRSAEAEAGTQTPLLVHCDLQVVDSNLNGIAPSFWSYAGLRPARHRLQQLLFQNTVTGCAVLCNRALIRAALPGHPKAMMHDHWLALHASAYGKIIPESAALVRYRQHGSNTLGATRGVGLRQLISDALGRLTEARDWQLLLQQPAAFLDSNNGRLPAATQQMLSDLLAVPRQGGFRRRWLLIKWGFGPADMLRRIWFWLKA
jgi:glycosyltransferase involved in cell wall biosynthesis